MNKKYEGCKLRDILNKKGNTEAYMLDCILHVELHGTVIVKYDGNNVTLNTTDKDGIYWHTPVTKSRINLVAELYHFDFKVYQEKNQWYVQLFDKSLQDAGKIPFEEGMTFSAHSRSSLESV